MDLCITKCIIYYSFSIDRFILNLHSLSTAHCVRYYSTFSRINNHLFPNIIAKCNSLFSANLRNAFSPILKYEAASFNVNTYLCSGNNTIDFIVNNLLSNSSSILPLQPLKINKNSTCFEQVLLVNDYSLLANDYPLLANDYSTR